MIYVKDGKEVIPKTYYDIKRLEREGYVLKVKKKRGRPPKKVSDE